MADVKLIPAAGIGKHLVKSSPGGLLFLSIIIQLLLAFFFGHIYDMRIFMATGYLVGTGQNPYIPQDLSQVFHNSLFQGITTTGYPPPWALICGLVYRAIRPLNPSFLAYNLALKTPIIAANIALAYLVTYILRFLGADADRRRAAWVYMLLNPFILYVTSAWGQFDSLVALFSLLAIFCLAVDRLTVSSLLLALAIAFKPTAFPLIFAAFIYLMTGKPFRKTAWYFMIFLASSLVLWIGPFILFHWDPSPILRGWNAHFVVAGGISFMTFYELIKDTYQLQRNWWFLGSLWIPALLIAVIVAWAKIKGLKELLRKSVALVLVLFLTRAWLSEPNIVLLVPFILILCATGELDSRALLLVWLLPLIFSIFNTAPIQLLFPSLPGVMSRLLELSDLYRTARLLAKTISVVPWLLAGWWIVYRCLRRSPTQAA